MIDNATGTNRRRSSAADGKGVVRRGTVEEETEMDSRSKAIHPELRLVRATASGARRRQATWHGNDWERSSRILPRHIAGPVALLTAVALCVAFSHGTAPARDLGDRADKTPVTVAMPVASAKDSARLATAVQKTAAGETEVKVLPNRQLDVTMTDRDGRVLYRQDPSRAETVVARNVVVPTLSVAQR